jgi:hypothetical protein
MSVFFPGGPSRRFEFLCNVLLKSSLIHLLHPCVGHRVDKLNPLRELKHGRVLPFQEGDHFLKGQPGAGLGLDVGTNPLAHEGIGHGNHRHSGNPWMAGDQPLDFRGTDALPAPVDHFFDAAGEGDVALLVDSGQIPGPEEPVPGEDFPVFFWIVVITGEDPWALENQFTFGTHRKGLPLLVDDLVGIEGARGPPHRGANDFERISGARDGGFSLTSLTRSGWLAPPALCIFFRELRSY